MKFPVDGQGDLEIVGLTPVSLPALRLVQYHAPDMALVCKTAKGTISVRLGDVNLRPSLTPAEPAKLGG